MRDLERSALVPPGAVFLSTAWGVGRMVYCPGSLASVLGCDLLEEKGHSFEKFEVVTMFSESSGDGAGKKRGRPSRRAEIVAATKRLVREQGASSVTTRAIAQSVPCSEGAIYVHFADRVDLLLAVLDESLPEMLVPLRELKAKLGLETPEDNLVCAVEGLRRFQEKVVVMLCSLAGEPELRERFQQSLQAQERGPQRGVATLAAYIEAEQALGRVAAGVDPGVAGQMLMATVFFQVFCAGVLAEKLPGDARALVRGVIGDRH